MKSAVFTIMTSAFSEPVEQIALMVDRKEDRPK